jgi:predicted nucleic acid-binding protein
LADTSVAVPLVMASHAAHAFVLERVGRRTIGLPSHAAVETYSVLTRLPGDSRLAPLDAATLLAARFPTVVSLSSPAQRKLVSDLSRAGIAGGAVYDAVIALTARQARATLLTRDSRAAATYALLEVAYELVVQGNT